MNIYLVTRTDNWGYDDYDSFVVACESEDFARRCHPREQKGELDLFPSPTWSCQWSSWTLSPDNVTVELLGTSNATTPSIILSSFNAG